MNSMFEQILNLLNSETGSLAYHLVLSFSIIGALALAQSQWEHNQSPRRRRILIGLMLLLGMQLLLFFMNLLMELWLKDMVLELKLLVLDF